MWEMLVNKDHWLLFTVDTVLQCPASVDLRYSCYLLTIDQVSTDHRPSVDQLLTDTSVKHRRTIGEVLVKYQWTKSYIGRNTSGTTIDRASTKCCLTIVRVSNEYRPQYWPSLDRLSTECRPLYRPIDRLTLPTLNRIRPVIRTVGTILSKICSQVQPVLNLN